MYHIPEVSVSVNGKEQIMSVLSRDLMSKRTIYLNGEINDEAALSIITQLHYLEDNSQEPITLVINSPGGSVSAGLAIYDVMQALSCPVTTAAIGLAASMAALVLALYAVVLLVRLTRGGARVRAYIHEQTAQKLPSLCRATAVLCAAASAGQGVAVFAADAQLLWGMQGVFILFELLSCAAFAAAAWLLKRMPWEKEE